MARQSVTQQHMAAEISRLLKEYLHKHGYNQSDLARRCGLPRDRISNYVRGASAPNLTNARAIERVTGLRLTSVIERHRSGNTSGPAPMNTLTATQLSDGLFDVHLHQRLTATQLYQVLAILKNEPETDGPLVKSTEEQLSLTVG